MGWLPIKSPIFCISLIDLLKISHLISHYIDYIPIAVGDMINALRKISPRVFYVAVAVRIVLSSSWRLEPASVEEAARARDVEI